MTQRDLDELIRKINLLRELFFDLAAIEGQNSKLLLSKYIRQLRLQEIEPLLADFNSEIYKVQLFSRYVHKPLYDKLTECLSNSNISDAISEITITIGIAKRRTWFDSICRRKSEPALFGEKELSIRSVINTLTELKSLMLSMREHIKCDYEASIVDEYCNTDNIDKETVLSFIDAAIDDIQDVDDISNLVKIYLIDHLAVAKGLLGKQSTAWRKVVGTLVIAATLINEVANIPKAEQDVQNAIRCIIEPSVKQNAGSSRRPIPLPIRKGPELTVNSR